MRPMQNNSACRKFDRNMAKNDERNHANWTSKLKNTNTVLNFNVGKITSHMKLTTNT